MLMTDGTPRIQLPESECKPRENESCMGQTDPQQLMSVSVIVRRKQPLQLAQLQGRHISREEFATRYAADPADFDALREFAHTHGLTIDESASSLQRRTMVLRGTAQAMSAAFGVTLEDYELPTHQGRRFHAYKGALTLPATEADRIEAVLGLDTRPIARPHFRFRETLPGEAAAQAQSFNPPQVAQLYNFPTDVDGTGEAIGIIELGGGYLAADIQNYFQGLGIKPPKVTAVSVDGAVNSPTNANSADGEVLLDIEVAGGVAPGASVAVYFAPNTDQGFQDALTTAIHDMTNKPSVISISWGSAESNWTPQAMTAFDNACQSAAALGVTIATASGDNGSTDGVTDGGDHVDFPSSSPHVLACGGTQLVSQGGKITQETVWNDLSQGGGATGGGVSQMFALPAWQANAKVPPPPGGGSGGRGVPDVAGDAAPNSGYNILVDGQSEVVGGTSAVAPLWAGLIALINQKRGTPVGFLNPTLYPAKTGLRDIVSGSNGTYSAGPGWDACTGLGSPDGSQLATLLVAAPAASNDPA